MRLPRLPVRDLRHRQSRVNQMTSGFWVLTLISAVLYAFILRDIARELSGI
jgi:hypothetical protein